MKIMEEEALKMVVEQFTDIQPDSKTSVEYNLNT